MVQAACECLPHTVQSMLADLAYDFLKDKTQTQFMTLPHILNMCISRFNAVSFVCVWFGAGVAVCGRVVDSGLCGILARVYDAVLCSC